LSNVPDFDPERDIEVFNLNFLKDKGASPKSPFVLMIWNHISKESAERLKKSIVFRYNGISLDSDRSIEIQEKFPLRVIRLDICECGHGDEDHETEQGFTKVEDGACCICVCKKFTLPMRQ